MTTWLEIANGDIDQDSPVTQPLMTGLRDNVRAAAEGSSGAPVLSVGWHPYDKADTDGVEVGDVYDFSDDGAVASVESPTFEDGYEYAFVIDGVSSSGAATEFRISLYRDTDAAYFTDQAILSGFTAATEVMQGIIQVEWPRISKYVHGTKWISEGHVFRVDSGTVTVSSGLDTQFSDATKQTVSKARFSFDTGNLDAGTIRMLRRREYVSG